MPERGATLLFDNIHLSLKNNVILNGVSGKAEPGKLVAFLGPSGSGKTTLIHVISGRLAELNFGTVTVNGSPLTKSLRRKIALVLQDDIFFANLTLRETLVFTARLRLPSSMPHTAKLERVQEIVETLNLGDCLDTRIGDYARRGVSGGERKRANIACELLTDPAILILDEPTSGLDSNTALNLIKALKNYAATRHKTVVASIHQPSSQIFHLFDKTLLLVKGQNMYFGEASEALGYFARLGLHCEPHYNPADFMMDKARGTDEELSILIKAAKRKSWEDAKRTSQGFQTPSDWGAAADVSSSDPNGNAYQPLRKEHHVVKEAVVVDGQRYQSPPQNQRLGPPIAQDVPDFTQMTTISGKSLNTSRLPPIQSTRAEEYVPECNGDGAKTTGPSADQTSCDIKPNCSTQRKRTASELPPTRRGAPPRRERRNTVVSTSGGVVGGGLQNNVVLGASFPIAFGSAASESPINRAHLKRRKVSTVSWSQSLDSEEKWPTTFLDQIGTLTHRNLKQSRDIILSKLLVMKHVAVAVIVGLLWFQTASEETRINDIRGVHFFTLVYWAFEAMYAVINVFPSERVVINKERLSGAYRLSAYYIAKMISELPLSIIMPSIFYVIFYWMAGLNSSALAFIASWLTLLLNVLVGQSIGLAIGAYAPSVSEAVILVTLFMLTTLMLGGFYIQILPGWLNWCSYLSYTYYFFTLQMHFQFGLDGEIVKCKEVNSVFEACHRDNVTHIEGVQVLNEMPLLPLSVPALFAITVGFCIFFRLLGYVILRFVRTPT